MRQLLVQVTRGYGQDVLKIAKSYQGANLLQFEAIGSDKLIDVVIIYPRQHHTAS